MAEQKSNQITIPLCIGKPEDGSRNGSTNKAHGASFSRFILPFAYQIEKSDIEDDADQSKALYFEVNSKENLSFTKRRKYFTEETGKTLYNRSIWLDMSESWNHSDWGKGEVTVKLRNNKEYQIGMLQPRIVLFEAVENSIKSLAEKEHTESTLQTGFLTVDIYFPWQKSNPELDDYLMLNEYFRYFGMPYDDHSKYFSDAFGDIPSDYYPRNSTVKNISKKDDGKLACYFERWANMLEIPIRENGKCYRLFPKEYGENARALAYNKEHKNTDNNWDVYADNRCYVWTAAFLEEGGKTLKRYFSSNHSDIKAKNYGHWIKLLNIDNPDFKNGAKGSHNSITNFDRQWADERTYKRWEERGTWYGYSYHSGAALASQKDINMIFHPWSSYYFDTNLLMFYIRMTLFRFSHSLSEAVQDKENIKRETLIELRRSFSQFSILYQNPLLSNQQQHLEMYELSKKHFETNELFEKVNKEINSTHDFLELVESNRLGNIANSLARWGIPLATSGLAVSILGLSTVGDVLKMNNDPALLRAAIQIGLVAIVFCVTYCIVKNYLKGKK